jgi:Tfp pilus assembly protein PilN
MKAVNLIPTEQRRVQASGKQSGSAYVVVGVLVTLLAMVAAYVVTANSVTDKKNQAAAAKSEADRLEAEVAARGAYTNFADIKKTRLASVMGVAESRFDWERLMRELSRVMPEGSWLQNADASLTGEIDGEGTATNPTTGLPEVSGPKAKLVGCTPDQSDVARMMVRMRQVHRVEDVELNESATDPTQNEEVSQDTCGRYYQYDITLSFAQTPPDTEAPRGEGSVPASLGGGS